MIEFEISIEIFLKGQDDPCIIWIWECKDYASSIPVDDLEEFHSKLEQIGADKTKGTMVCRGAYQEGAVQYARSKGIGLSRLLPAGQIHIVASAPNGPIDIAYKNHLANPAPLTIEALTSINFRSMFGSFYGFLSSGQCGAWSSMDNFISAEAQQISRDI